MSIQHCGTGNPVPSNCYTTTEGVTTVFSPDGVGHTLLPPVSNPFTDFLVSGVPTAAEATGILDAGLLLVLFIALVSLIALAVGLLGLIPRIDVLGALRDRTIIRASKKAMTVLNETLTREGIGFTVCDVLMYNPRPTFTFPATRIALPPNQPDWFVCVEVHRGKAVVGIVEADELTDILDSPGYPHVFERRVPRWKLQEEFNMIVRDVRLAWLDFPVGDPYN